MSKHTVNHSNLGPWAQGTVPAGGSQLIGLSGAPMPFTITLKSSLAGRLIELTTDGGVEYFTPTVTQSSATMQIVSVSAPVSGARLTGTSGDVWSVR